MSKGMFRFVITHSTWTTHCISSPPPSFSSFSVPFQKFILILYYLRLNTISPLSCTIIISEIIFSCGSYRATILPHSFDACSRTSFNSPYYTSIIFLFSKMIQPYNRGLIFHRVSRFFPRSTTVGGIFGSIESSLRILFSFIRIAIRNLVSVDCRYSS